MALGIVSVVAAAWSLEHFDVSLVRLPTFGWAIAVGAGFSLIVGYLAPAPWVLAAVLGGILTVLWLLAVRWYIGSAWPPDALDDYGL